jgi:hypothetical protein
MHDAGIDLCTTDSSLAVLLALAPLGLCNRCTPALTGQKVTVNRVLPEDASKHLSRANSVWLSLGDLVGAIISCRPIIVQSIVEVPVKYGLSAATMRFRMPAASPSLQPRMFLPILASAIVSWTSCRCIQENAQRA